MDKLNGFSSFDWDKDERWRSYLRNIELPGADTASALQKVKAKWYKRNIDPDFEVEAATPGPKPTTSNANQSSGTSQRPAAAASSARAAGSAPAPSTAPKPGSSWGGWGGSTSSTYTSSTAFEQRTFFLHVLLILAAFFHLLPVLPIANCSLQSYWWFMRLVIFTQGYKVYVKHGMPTLWPFNWPALQMWLSRAMGSTEFFHVMTAFAFMGNRSPVSLAMAPVLLVAMRQVLAYASRQYSGMAWWQATGGKAQAWVTSKEALLNQVSTWSEIALGFFLIVQLVSPSRNFLLIFFYWNMLKMRYVTPESASNHRMAWAYLDQQTIKYRMNMPMVEKAIHYIRAWFLNVGR